MQWDTKSRVTFDGEARLVASGGNELTGPTVEAPVVVER
jgi:hypothetical protein